MEASERCLLCLGSDAPVDAADPRLRDVVQDLFSFWPSEVTVVACSQCFKTIEEFYAFYQRVRENQSILRNDAASRSISADIVKVEEMGVKEEWDKIVVKKEKRSRRRRRNNVSSERNYTSDEDGTSTNLESLDTRDVLLDKLPEGGSSVACPTELIRDGKFVVSQNLLEDMASNFFNLKCAKCNKKFEKLYQLLTHYMSAHKGRPFVECCDKKIYQKRFIYQHMAKHLQPSAFQCPICNKEFSRIINVKNHLGHHVPEEEKIHRCNKCNRSFGYKSLLTKHMITHIPNEKKQLYKCEKCSKTFTIYGSYINHVRTMHSAPKFLCPQCGKSFRQKVNLLEHLEIHSGERVQCPICEVMCKTNNILRKHMKLHSDVRFNCEQCEYTTRLKSLLKQHMLTKHSEEKPFSCEVCGKQFKLKTVLQTHMAQHTGERKYICQYCPKTFASSGNLFIHRKRMHSDEYKSSLQGK